MTSTVVSRFSVFAALLAALVIQTPAWALFLQPPSVPSERLIKNLTAYIEENPKDAEAHYLLARVHYMSFVNRLDHVRSNDPGSAEKLPKLVDPRQYGKAEGKEIDEAAAIAHARSAIEWFRKAIELNEKNAVYHLGLAGIFEQAAPLAEKIGAPDTLKPQEESDSEGDNSKLAKSYAAEALKANLAAYKLDREAALAKDSLFLPFYPTAYEAGKAVERLVKKYELKLDDDKLLDQIAADMNAINSKPKAITPIVMRIKGEEPTSLAHLIASSKSVRFDLDADGVAERRAWVRPDTAFLVWDPTGAGKITSGEQLFGNMTFFMLFSDGYRALDSLDDNRDGKLADKELEGLALWHDRNSNGVSDPGEVTPIAKTSVRSIRTQATGSDKGHPMNSVGVTLKDGSKRATWDWVIPGGSR